MTENQFYINTFSDYNKVSSQYNSDFIKKALCVKISETDKIVTICTAESTYNSNKILKSVHQPKKVIFNVVKDSDFSEFIGNCLDINEVSKTGTSDQKDKTNLFNLEEVNNDAPIVNIINAICLEALRKNASDIHIQPLKDTISIRYRIDGVLHTVKQLNKSVFDNLISRLKIMSNLNIMENRLPQDGRMSVLLEGNKIDLRISIIPTSNGQSVVLRLFNLYKENIPLKDLGFTDEIYKKLLHGLHIPYGIILVTGPTGSGKTTTLHALIEEMDKEHLKIITIEDPVEQQINGIDQIQVNESIGLNFSSILKRVLRQDPDVIMIGEIRDAETANLAIRAALTGHIVLATLHANDCVSTIIRLQNLGVEPYLISSVLKFSIAQRLVRKNCTNCHGKGCNTCNNTGYKGRTVVSEILENNDKISKLIPQKDNESLIRDHLKKNRFKWIKDDAILKVESGITSNEELEKECLL